MGPISLWARTWRPAFAAPVAIVAAVSLLFAAPSADARSNRGKALRAELPTRYSQYPQFFANGQHPQAQSQPALRELCYEAFAVLHSGSTRTPVYVSQRLKQCLIKDADKKRADRFFANARLPRNERA